MMWKIIMLCIIVVLTDAQKKNYKGYKVFRIVPQRQEEIDKLNEMEEFMYGISFWVEPNIVGQNVDIMVAPQCFHKFMETLLQMRMSYQIYIGDVQKSIDQTSRKRRSPTFTFTEYHTLEEIYEYLDDLAKEFPNNVEIIVGGKTYETRQIKGVKLTFDDEKDKEGIFIEGGIHAREWISPATVTYILHQLLYSGDEDVRELAESHNWYIFPVFNPDGYVYTHTTDRLWRKSVKPLSAFGVGVDLNRNWFYMWRGSNRPKSRKYSGIVPFSEIETRSMAEFITSIANKFYAYISFHSYSQLLMYPYAYTAEKLDNHEDLHAIGLKAVEALRQRYGTEYQVGNVGQLMYICNGVSTDYIKGSFKKPIVFTYELRGQRKKDGYGFLLPPDQIIPTGEEIVDSLVAMFQEVRARNYSKKSYGLL